jgi:hypothetical protein
MSLSLDVIVVVGGGVVVVIVVDLSAVICDAFETATAHSRQVDDNRLRCNSLGTLLPALANSGFTPLS